MLFAYMGEGFYPEPFLSLVPHTLSAFKNNAGDPVLRKVEKPALSFFLETFKLTSLGLLYLFSFISQAFMLYSP